MTAKAPASKSEAKRVAAQKAAPKYDDRKLNELRERVEALEATNKILVEAWALVADETRGLYGLQAISAIADAIVKRLK